MDLSYSLPTVKISVQSVEHNNMPRTHAHDTYELYYLLEGERYLFAGGSFYSVRAGDIFLIPPHLEHRTLDSGSAGYSRITVNISHSLMPRVNVDGVYFVSPREKNARLLEIEAREICSSSGDASACATAVGAAMKMLGILLSESERRESRVVDSLRLGRMAEILEYLDENYASDISLSTLSERFFISEFYLCRLFKEYTGKTILAYLTELRIKRAERLIDDGGEKMCRVAKLAGFGSVSAFCTAFRKINGVSPKKWKSRNKM